MTCENAWEWMSAALDGELSAAEKAELDRHLAQCDSCRALFAELSAIHGACGGLDAASPPGLKEQILNGLPPQEAPAPKGSGKVISIHWKRWSAMAAAFVLISLAAWRLPETISQPPRSAVEVEKDQPQEMDEATLQDYDAANESGVAILTTAGEAVSPADASAPAPTALQNSEDLPVNGTAEPSQTKLGGLENDTAKSEETVKSSAVSVFRGIAADTDGSAAGSDPEAASPAQTPVVNGSLSRSFVYSSAPLPQDSLSDEAVTADMDASDLPVAEATNGLILAKAASGGGGSAPLTADDEILEPHPEIGEGENVPAVLFVSGAEEQACPSYCGVLTLSNAAFLNEYSAQPQETGEVWYELPRAAFYALVDELTAGGVSLDLRASGDDISASAELGLVIVLP